MTHRFRALEFIPSSPNLLLQAVYFNIALTKLTEILLEVRKQIFGDLIKGFRMITNCLVIIARLQVDS